MSSPTGFKILGQEPAFLVGVVESVLVGLLAFNVFGNLTQETIAIIVAAVAAGLGLVTAYATKTTLYSALVGFAKAILVLAVTFGAPLNDVQTTALMATITLVAGAYLREKTSSVETAVSEASPGTAAAVPTPVVVVPSLPDH